MILETANSSQTKLVGQSLHVSEHRIGYLNLTPGGPVALLGDPGRVKIKFHQIKKILLIKDVKYASGVTKMHLGSPLDPWGLGDTWGGPQGVNLKFHQIKNFPYQKYVLVVRHLPELVLST